jgi:hypothetical protein
MYVIPIQFLNYMFKLGTKLPVAAILSKLNWKSGWENYFSITIYYLL